MSSFFASALGQWGVNRQINSFKKEVDGMFGSGEQDQVYLDDTPDVQYNKDEHQSFTAKRAEAAKQRGQQNCKSDAVRQAMERRAARQASIKPRK